MRRVAIARVKDQPTEKPLMWPIYAILIFAFAVRVYSVGYNSPYPKSPEEERIVKQAFKLTTTGLKPRQFDKPALMSYVLAGEYGALFGVGHIFGRFRWVYEFEAYFLKDPSLFYILGRLTSAAFGVLGIYILFILGRGLFEWGVGAMAAFMMAVEPHHIALSQMATGDAFALLFVILGLYYIANTGEERRIGSTFVGAVFIGFASAVEFSYAALAAFALVAYMATIPGRYRVGAWLTGLPFLAISFLFGMLLPSGMLLLSPREFAQGAMGTIYLNASTGDLGSAAERIDYLRQLVSTDLFGQAIGWGLIGAGSVGLLWGMGFAKKNKAKFLVVVIFLLVAGVFYFPWERDTFVRWACLLSLPLSIGAAHVIYRLFWRRWMPATLGVALMMVAAAAVSAQPAAEAGAASQRKTADDTRSQFGKWAMENLPHTSRVLVTTDADVLFNVITLRPGTMWITWRQEVLAAWNARGFQVRELPNLPLDSRRLPPVTNYDYVVADTWTTRRLESAGPASRAWAAALTKNQPLLSRFASALSTQPERAKAILALIAEAKASGEVIASIPEPAPGLKGYGPGIEVIKVANPTPPETEVQPSSESSDEGEGEVSSGASGAPAIRRGAPAQPGAPARPHRAARRRNRQAAPE